MDIFDIINFIPFLDTLSVMVGAFIGWNVPQPTYMKLLQKWVVNKWKEFRSKEDK